MLVERGSGVSLAVTVSGTGRPALVLPAWGVPASYYGRFAAALSGAGFSVAVADWRGTGASTPAVSRSSRFGYRETLADIDAVLSALAWDSDVTLVGHSFGGQMALAYSAAYRDPRVARAVPIAAGLPYFAAYPGVQKARILALTQTMFGVSSVLGYWPGWTFGGVQSRGMVSDWASVARTGRFPSWIESRFASLSLPVLAVDVEGDDVTPAPTFTHLLRKLSSASITRVEYTSAEAGGPVDHFKWVRVSAPLAARIASFAEAPAV